MQLVSLLTLLDSRLLKQSHTDTDTLNAQLREGLLSPAITALPLKCYCKKPISMVDMQETTPC